MCSAMSASFKVLPSVRLSLGVSRKSFYPPVMVTFLPSKDVWLWVKGWKVREI